MEVYVECEISAITLVTSRDEYIHYTVQVGPEDTATENGQRVADVADGVAWYGLQYRSVDER